MANHAQRVQQLMRDVVVLQWREHMQSAPGKACIVQARVPGKENMGFNGVLQMLKSGREVWQMGEVTVRKNK
ncbi:hypothetical protein JCM14635_00790 [Megalodesulfovibrio paquesii]